jgi:hypothetical protein
MIAKPVDLVIEMRIPKEVMMFPFWAVAKVLGEDYNSIVERCLRLAKTPQQHVESLMPLIPELHDQAVRDRLVAEIKSAATVHWENVWLIRHSDPGVPDWLKLPVRYDFSGPHQTVVTAEASEMLKLLETRGTEIHSVIGMEEWMGEEG